MTDSKGKYASVCQDTVQRLHDEAAKRYKSRKEADKAVKNTLHQITGMFAERADLKRARRLLEGVDDDKALHDTLALHASTRERLEHIEAFYDTLLSPYRLCRVLDLACGLNPIYLGARGYQVFGIDINGECVDLVNAWARKHEWPVTAVCADLLALPPLPESDIALCMKLLPVLEQQKKGASLSLLRQLPCKSIVVTFPVRTLGGRKVGMAQHYDGWFRDLIHDCFEIVRCETIYDELCYIIESKQPDGEG